MPSITPLTYGSYTSESTRKPWPHVLSLVFCLFFVVVVSCGVFVWWQELSGEIPLLAKRQKTYVTYSEHVPEKVDTTFLPLFDPPAMTSFTVPVGEGSVVESSVHSMSAEASQKQGVPEDPVLQRALLLLERLKALEEGI